MRAHPWLLSALAALLIISLPAVRVQAQSPTGGAYWGQHTLDSFAQIWPVVALVVFGALLAGGLFGFYDLDSASLIFLLAGLAFLGYHLYRHPVHPGSSLFPPRSETSAAQVPGHRPAVVARAPTTGQRLLDVSLRRRYRAVTNPWWC
jgi:hypothetical protein